MVKYLFVTIVLFLYYGCASTLNDSGDQRGHAIYSEANLQQFVVGYLKSNDYGNGYILSKPVANVFVKDDSCANNNGDVAYIAFKNSTDSTLILDAIIRIVDGNIGKVLKVNNGHHFPVEVVIDHLKNSRCR